MSATDPHVHERRAAPSGNGYRTYHGQPVLKEPEWTWEVPWYLFTGGLAGAASALAFGARIAGNDALADRAGQLAAASAVASPALLVADLGRPARFVNMLRVFKPTSAMSMGSWLLAGYVPLAAGAAGLRRLGRLPKLQRISEAKAAVLGPAMATYTGVLLADSSVPVWHEARGHLPWVFAGSAAAAAGGAATLAAPAGSAGPARRLALAGAAAELAAGAAMRRHLGELGEPYEHGDTGRWDRAARACTGAGAALMAAGGRGPRRAVTLTGAALLVAGSACNRWAVYRAGFGSATDPKYVVRPQRERLDRGAGHRRDGGAPRNRHM